MKDKELTSMFEFLNYLSDDLASAFDHFNRSDCIRHADVSLEAESRSRDDEDAALSECVYELLFVDTLRNLGESVESALRDVDFEASCLETCAECLATGVVPGNVDVSIARLSNSALEEGRAVDESECAVVECDSRHEQIAARTNARVDCNVSNALSRDRKVLGEGCDDDIVDVLSAEDVAVSASVVDNVSIRFVTDDPDRMTVLLCGSLGNAGDSINALLRIDSASRVVGAVEDDGTGLLTNNLLKGCSIREEGLRVHRDSA